MISWFEKNNKLSWVITFIGAGLIFYISSLVFIPPTTGYALGVESILYHICAFFGLGLFLQISLNKGEKNWLVLIAGIFIAIAYGVSDEFHQVFVLGRNCSVLDVGWDSIGIVFSAMVYVISLEFRKQNL